MATQRRARSNQTRNRKKPASKAGKRGLPGWVWGLGGLAIGLFVALIINLEQRTDSDALDAIMDGSGSTSAPQRPDAGADEPDTASDDGTGDAPQQDEPRFEFYKLLPEQEVAVPDTEQAPRRPSPEAAEPPVDDGGTDGSEGQQRPIPGPDPEGRFVLQAGSFQGMADADRMKAELALLGVEAGIESVELSGGETWHRVRAGPYSDRQAVNEIRARLQRNDIDTILLKRGE